jgi:phage terminase large subunit-like protein
MSQDIKQIIKQEYLKCATDPVYFAKKYVYITHPTRGRIQFSLYPFQEDVLKLFMKEDYHLILKSRQLGISTLVALYSLWIMLFNKDKNILVLCTKTDTAKNMVTKVKFMHDNLPSWLRTGKPDENNKLTFKLKNGSQIKAVSAAGDSGRSEAVSLLIMDEAALFLVLRKFGVVLNKH